MGDGEVSRDGRRLAAVFSYGARARLRPVRRQRRRAHAAAAPPLPLLAPACSSRPMSAAAILELVARMLQASRAETSKRDRGACGSTPSALTSGARRAGPSPVLSASGSEPDWGTGDPPAAAGTSPCCREMSREKTRPAGHAQRHAEQEDCRRTRREREAATEDRKPRATVRLNRGDSRLDLSPRCAEASRIEGVRKLCRRYVPLGDARAQR